MKIGLFGGTFDPIHYGHLIAAENVREKYRLEEIIFIPNARPPHKNRRKVAPVQARCTMVKLATQDHASFQVSLVEIERRTPSYTVETIREFRKTYDRDSLYFIIGSDSIFEMHAWYHVDELAGLCRFVYVERPGFTWSEKDRKRSKLSADVFRAVTQNCCVLNPVGISSTDIRNRIRQGRSIRYLVPEEVRQYILKTGLYRPS